MPYSDQQIQALMAAKPEDVQAVLGAMNPAQVKELTSAVTAFKANASGGWRDVGAPPATAFAPPSTATQPQQQPGWNHPIDRISAAWNNAKSDSINGPGLWTKEQLANGMANQVSQGAFAAGVPVAQISGAIQSGLPSAMGRFAAPVARVLTDAGIGAVTEPAFTDNSNVTDWGEKAQLKANEALHGAKVGGALGLGAEAVGPVIGAVSKVAQAAKVAPSPGAFLQELGNRFSGKTPGEAFQGAAQAKYDSAWDEFKKAVAPVDAQASTTPMDYSPAISKIENILGVGQKRSPSPLNANTQKSLETLLGNLKEAQAGGNVDNSFAGAIDTVKWLGQEGRRLAVQHGDTAARGLFNGVRDSLLDAMTSSNPMLAENAANARKVFAEKVVPLFDKSEGGQYLTQIRDINPKEAGDLLIHGDQGSLARMLPGKAATIAQGSSADPMLYSYLDAAITQAKGNPRVFSDSLTKAMPAIEAISDPATVASFKGMAKVAQASNLLGTVANYGGVLVPGHEAAGAAIGLGARFSPAYSGPGLLWKALSTDVGRKLFTFASKLPEGSPELQAIAGDILKSVRYQGVGSQVFNPNQTPEPK